MAEAVRVTGLKELKAAFARIAGDLPSAMRAEMRVVAEPVRADATQLATDDIRNMGAGRWSQMRVGVTAKSVYVAPKAHRRGGPPRPNLKALLMQRSLEPALEKNRDAVGAGFDEMLARLTAEF